MLGEGGKGKGEAGVVSGGVRTSNIAVEEALGEEREKVRNESKREVELSSIRKD